MDKILTYKGEVTRAMHMLAQNQKVLFIGQTVLYPGSVISDTLKDVPKGKLLELPVAEELQMGMSIGMSLDGSIIPVSIYPRLDFLLLAMNQLSSHLDVLEELTHGVYHAKVIIRTIIGAKEPMYPGIQHCRDLTEVFRVLLKDIDVVKLASVAGIIPAYTKALESPKSTLIIEMAELYDGD